MGCAARLLPAAIATRRCSGLPCRASADIGVPADRTCDMIGSAQGHDRNSKTENCPWSPWFVNRVPGL
ncbi:hypothetical protein HNQ71_001005 [Mesorhizobium sangaii]|uniref:Uncharacterized protein n=1 Tax=Mesorhizobium sangaii TaxID=505389 RepID=A0A841P469_9HYPH|nr:hypothetical protein [Mesorhizobium sangaii]